MANDTAPIDRSPALFGRVRGAIVVDLFAGGGGASEGVRRALGYGPVVAINHVAAHLGIPARTLLDMADRAPAQLPAPRIGVGTGVRRMTMRNDVGARGAGVDARSCSSEAGFPMIRGRRGTTRSGAFGGLRFTGDVPAHGPGGRIMDDARRLATWTK